MKNSIDLSLPKERTVRGYTIKRMPIGAYLKALQTLQDFPRDVAAKLLPSGNVLALLEQLKKIDRATLADLAIKALTIVPEQCMGLVCQLTGIPKAKLLTDADIGMDGLAEIVDAWLEINGAENFLRAAKSATGKIAQYAAALKAGSKS